MRSKLVTSGLRHASPNAYRNALQPLVVYSCNKNAFLVFMHLGHGHQTNDKINSQAIGLIIGSIIHLVQASSQPAIQ